MFVNVYLNLIGIKVIANSVVNCIYSSRWTVAQYLSLTIKYQFNCQMYKWIVYYRKDAARFIRQVPEKKNWIANLQQILAIQTQSSFHLYHLYTQTNHHPYTDVYKYIYWQFVTVLLVFVCLPKNQIVPKRFEQIFAPK